ncbi:MAG: efflux RND transporter periplasmic adaptor subunit [Thermodesulfovibrionales bacterium]
MNKKIAKSLAVAVAVVLVLWWLFSPVSERKSSQGIPGAKTGAPSQAGKKERKIKYWVAPMDPTYIRDKPGKSPMGMDLVPVYEDEEPTAEGVIRIDPVTIQNIGVKTTKVTKGALIADIRTVGHVAYNEGRVDHIHTKVSGWVERLFVDTTGQDVRKGEKLLTIYSPELVATQEEYLQALEYAKRTEGSKFNDISGSGKSLIDATRRRLLLMDINPGQIEALEKSGEIQKTMALYSPTNGIVIDKKVLAGMKVTPGTELYTLADLSNVWILGSIYEYELPFVEKGQEAEVILPYEPGVVYKGRISFIYPYLSAATRTVQVRIDFKNPRLKLKPDMYVDLSIKSKTARNVLQVPSDAVIRTGTRNVVITALGNGKFLPKEVELGPQGQGMVEIKSGLVEGETVVSSGQFLIDSESNLKQAVTRMIEAPLQAGAAKTSTPKTKPDAEKGKKEETPPALTVQLSSDQKHIMSSIMDTYIKIHQALIADAINGVTSNAKTLSDLVYKLRLTDLQGKLGELTEPMTKSVEGLSSGDLKRAKDAFAPLSRVLVAYVKGTGREEAHAAGIKVFYCPMKKEPWLQKGAAVKNPYLGKEMILCGNEIKY